MNRDVGLSQAFSTRIKAHAALLTACPPDGANAKGIRSAADEVDAASVLIDFAPCARSYAAFSELLRCCAMLVEFRTAVLNAELDANRFAVGARERARLLVEEYARAELAPGLIEVGRRIQDLGSHTQVEELLRAAVAIPLPIPYHQARPQAAWQRTAQEEDRVAPPAPLTVAFLAFRLNDVPAAETHYLAPQITHDLELELRISRWPIGAEALRLTCISIEAATTYDFPRFEILKPEGNPPYVIHQRGRALLRVPQSIHAKPFEFKYAAEFIPPSSEQPVAVVGVRSLRIESIDVERSPLTGYTDMDRKLLSLRNVIRERCVASEAQVRDLFLPLTALCNVACQAVQDNLFARRYSEAEFQADLRRDLRRRPELASELEEHPRAGGGITDLSFRRIRIELKSVSSAPMKLDDCDRYVDQTVSYAVGSHSRLAILCVLDCSEKSGPAFPAESGVKIVSRHDSDPVLVAIVLIQGNLVRPSELSR